jgi:hypothetical protein
MDKKTGMIVSIVGSVVFLCLSIACCALGAYMGLPTGEDPQYGYIAGGVCLGIFPILAAVALWIFLVVRNQDNGASQMDL